MLPLRPKRTKRTARDDVWKVKIDPGESTFVEYTQGSSTGGGNTVNVGSGSRTGESLEVLLRKCPVDVRMPFELAIELGMRPDVVCGAVEKVFQTVKDSDS